MVEEKKNHPDQDHEKEHYPVPGYQSTAPSTEVKEPEPEVEESVDLRDYLDVILRRKWLVLTFIVVVFFSTLVFSLIKKPVFKSTGSIEVNPKAPQVTKFKDLVANELRAQEYIQTQTQLLQKGFLANRVIDKLHLKRNPEFNPTADSQKKELGLLASVKKTILGWFNFSNEAHSANNLSSRQHLEKLKEEKALQKKVLSNLEINPQRETNLINVTYSSTEPDLTNKMVNTLMQEFIAWRMEKRIEASKSANKQLEKQVQEGRIQLEKARKRLNQYAQRAGIVSLDSRLNKTYKQMESINEALAQAEKERTIAEARYRQAKESDVQSLPQVVDNELIQELRKEYAKLQGQYNELLSKFKPAYPRLKQIKASMEDIKKRIAEEENRILNSLKNAYLSAKETEQALQDNYKNKKKLAMKLNNKATQYKILNQEVKTNKQIYQSLLDRSKEIHASVGTELSNIRIVSQAERPLMPYEPNIPRNLLLALVVGSLGGVGSAFFLEYLDNTIKRVEEVSDRFGLPVLGVVPKVEDLDQVSLDNLVKQRPKNNFSEAIRTCRTAIQLSSFDQQCQSLLITSTAPGEGKSTISLNLAQAFSIQEERVLLLECDLRAPRLYKKIKTQGRPKGLSQYLNGICDFKEIVHNLDKNFYLIPAGPIPPNPAELLASSKMRKFVNKLHDHFDRIIIDSPPFLGFADALIMGRLAQGVILTMTMGETQKESLRIFRRSLVNVQANVLGAIINKLQVSSHYGGYYNRYYKYYHRYYHDYHQDRSEQEALDQEKEGLESHPKQ